MSKKYDIIQLTEILAYPPNTQFADSTGVKNILSELGNYLSLGFEIYQAIPLTTRDFARIKYILRKEINE